MLNISLHFLNSFNLKRQFCSRVPKTGLRSQVYSSPCSAPNSIRIPASLQGANTSFLKNLKNRLTKSPAVWKGCHQYKAAEYGTFQPNCSIISSDIRSSTAKLSFTIFQSYSINFFLIHKDRDLKNSTIAVKIIFHI